jgi:hypothetical protein
VVRLTAPLTFLERWSAEPGELRGILAQTATSFENLYAHLFNAFHVSNETGEQYYFRFFDPLVLRAFLSSASTPELERLLRPMGRVLIENPESEAFTSIRMRGIEIEVESVSV